MTETKILEQYPMDLFPNKRIEDTNAHEIDYDRHYSIGSLIFIFFACSFIGWLWEVIIHIVEDGVLVNRGVLLGPWLPIYGSGSVLILLLLRPFFKRPVATFFSSMILCSSVEYVTSWYLELKEGIRWWDYSGYFLNINGRICLAGAVIFGAGGCAIVYFAAPKLDDCWKKLSKKLQLGICIVLALLFVDDLVKSHENPNTGKGITDYEYNQKNSPEISGQHEK